MNYINNHSGGICCAIGDRDRIEIEGTDVLVDCETGEDMTMFPIGFIPGRTYRYERRLAIKQSFNIIKTFTTREEAQAAYDSLIEKLARANTVIEI